LSYHELQVVYGHDRHKITIEFIYRVT